MYHLIDSFSMTDSKENWTDSCEKSNQYYINIKDGRVRCGLPIDLDGVFGWAERLVESRIYGTNTGFSFAPCFASW